MLILRSLAANLAFYLNLAFWMVVSLPTFVLPRRCLMFTARCYAVTSIALLRLIAGTDVRWIGLDKLPPGGCIVASKHQSAWDTFALIAILSDPCYILKRELTLIPLFGWYLRKAGMIAVRRGDGQREVLDELNAKARAAVEAGRQIIIFPEGTRRPPGAPPSYKSGVAHLYHATRATCVPVALNSGLFWPRRAMIRRPGIISVEVLDPILPGVAPKTFLRELEARIEGASLRLLAEARAPAAAAACAQPRRSGA